MHDPELEFGPDYNSYVVIHSYFIQFCMLLEHNWDNWENQTVKSMLILSF